MKHVCRRLILGAMIACLGFSSIGLAPQQAEAAKIKIPSIPKIPKIPSNIKIPGLSSAQVQALLANRSAVAQQLLALLADLAENGYVITNANLDPQTGVVLISSRNFQTGETRIDTISLFGSTDVTVKSKKK